MSEPDTSAIAGNIARFRGLLNDAVAAAGRAPGDVRLIAVTKNHPWQYAAEALRCGIVDLGENKVQELAAKRAELEQGAPELAATAHWHFIGRLQRNKVSKAVAAADTISSIDRVALAEAVARAAAASDRFSAEHPLGVLIQIDLDPQRSAGDGDSSAARGGVHPDDMVALAAVITDCPELALRGVMAVAPLGSEPREVFARLARLGSQLQEKYPQAREISAGMSADFADAIAMGSDAVRVGTALFGTRTLASDT